MACTIRTPKNIQGWIAVACSFLLNVLTIGMATSLGIFYIQWLNEWPNSSILLSTVTSVISVMLCSAPIAGVFIRKFGIRPGIAVGGALTSLGFLTTVYVHKATLLFLTISLVTGSGASLMYMAAVVAVSNHFTKNFATASGLANAGFNVGTLILPIIYQNLINSFSSWRKTCLVASGIQLLCFICVLVLKPKKAVDAEDHIEELGPTPSSQQDGTKVCSSYANVDLSRNQDNIDIEHMDYNDQLQPESTSHILNDDKSLPKTNMENTFIAKDAAHVEDNTLVLVETRNLSLIENATRHNCKNSLTLTGHENPCLIEDEEDNSNDRNSQSKNNCFVGDNAQHTKDTDLSKTSQTNIKSVNNTAQKIEAVETKSVQMNPSSYERCINEHFPEELSSELPEDKKSCTTVIISILRALLDSFNVRLLWTNVPFASFLVTSFLNSWILGTIFPHLAARALDANIPPDRAYFLISVIGVGSLFIRIFYGFLIDKGVIHPMYLLLISYGISTIGSAVIAFCVTFPLLCVSAFFIGVGSGIYVPIIQPIFRTMTGPNDFSGAVGIHLLFVGLGGIMSATCAGWILNATQSYTYVFLIPTSFGVATLAVTWLNQIYWGHYRKHPNWPKRISRN